MQNKQTNLQVSWQDSSNKSISIVLLLETNREVDTFLFLIKRGRVTFQIKLKSTMPKGAIDYTSLLVTSLSSVDNENSLIKS